MIIILWEEVGVTLSAAALFYLFHYCSFCNTWLLWYCYDGTCSFCSPVSALFSVVGFIFCLCFASSVAAQSGAIAGLGTAFIFKPILYEVINVQTLVFFKRWGGSQYRPQCGAVL